MDSDTDTLNTPLHVAARDGCLEDVTTLLQSNTEDVNAENNKGRTPLHLAVETCRPSVVEMLLKHGAKIHVKHKKKTTPFQLAAAKGLADIVEMMIHFAESAKRCESKDDEQDIGRFWFPFPQPSKTIRTRRILKRDDPHLIRKPENPIIVSEKILTSGDIAIQQFSIRLTHLFLGATPVTQKYQMKPGDVQYDIDPDDEEEIMPIRVTVRKKDEPSNILRRECFKALLYAIRSRRVDVGLLETLLLKTNILDGHEMNSDGYTALHFAMEDGRASSKVLDTLLNSGKFNVNALSPKSETPLFFAINHGHKHCGSIKASNEYRKEDQSRVLLLLQHKADINLRNWKGETALMRAAEYDSYHIIQLFIDWTKEPGIGIDLNARDWLGENALLKAARRRHSQTVKVLMDAGASVNFADYCGHTALHKALYEVLTPDDCIDSRYILKELCNGDVKLNLQEATLNEKLNTFLDEKLNPHDRQYFVYLFKELIDGNLTDSPDDQKAKIEELRNRDLQGMIEDCSRETEEELNKHRTINILLENEDTDVNAIDSRGNTPLDLALKLGVKTKPCTIEALKQRGAICKTFPLTQWDGKLKMPECVIDKNGGSPFHRLAIAHRYRPLESSKRRDYETFYIMLDGIRWFSKMRKDKCLQIVEVKDNQGRTALHKAIMPTTYSCDWLPDEDMRTLIGIASLLLKMGCNVNAIDNYGRTPLHYSSGPYADLFIDNGGNKDIRDIDGNSAIEMVQIRTKEEDMTRKYDEHGVTQYIKDKVVRISDIIELLQIDSSLLQSMNFQYGISPLYTSNDNSDYAKKILFTIFNKANFAKRNPISDVLNKELNNFVNRIVDGIKNYDPRFECRTIFVGSAFEKTKIDFPDEYDFDLVLTKFSELCEVFPSPVLPSGFVHLKRKQTKEHTTNQKFDDFFNAEGILLTNKVNAQFKLVLSEVLKDPMFLKNEHLFELDWRCDNDFNDRRSSGLNPNSLCTNLRLTLNRPLDGNYMFKEISVDIVPCIHIDNWWPEDALPGIRDDLKVDGCNLVFDQPHRKYPWIPFTDPCARISFAPIESRLIKESTEVAKTAYMVGKQLIKSSRGLTYILKTCFLYCNEALDPLHTTRTGRPSYKGMPDDYLKFLRSDMSFQGRFEELHFWVEKLLKCYLDFNLQDFCTCYMMPSFILPIGEYLKSNHIKLLFCEDFYEKRGECNPTRDYEEIYHLYHSISSSETDLSLELPKPEPLLERFDREDLLEKLATPLSYSARYQAMRLLLKGPLHPENESNELRVNRELREEHLDEEEEEEEEQEDEEEFASSDEYYSWDSDEEC